MNDFQEKLVNDSQKKIIHTFIKKNILDSLFFYILQQNPVRSET